MLRAKYFSTALSFTAIFDSGCLIWWGGGLWMDGREQKVGGRGCEGWRPFAGDDWDKA